MNPRLHPRGHAPLASTLAVLAAVVSACAPSGDGRGVDASRSELVARSLTAAVVSADTLLILELFWPQATYDDVAGQHSHEGIDEIVGHLTAVHDWADDVYMNVGRVHVHETGAVSEWVLALTPRETGAEVVMFGATILELEGGRIVRAADYVDTWPLRAQVGETSVPE